MKNKLLIPVLFLITFSVVAFTFISQDPPVPFIEVIIDNEESGDCKALADIDGDGDLDPVLGGNKLVWYESGEQWQKHIISASTVYEEFSTDMQAGDVDSDGDADIVLGDGGGPDNLLWFENPRINPPAGKTNDYKSAENWIYHKVGTHGEWVHDIELGDLDNDGKMDIVSSGHGHTHLWKQDSGYIWKEKNITGAGSGVYLYDINKNGRLDIVVPDGWFDTPEEVINGTWNFYPIDVGSPKDEVLVMDVDGDENPDLVTIDAHNAEEFAWFKNPGNPEETDWEKHTIDETMGSHKLETADFNKDGRPDILVGRELNDLSIYFNIYDTSVTFFKQQLSNNAAHNARAGDINGDGHIDVFGCDYIGHPPVKIYLNDTLITDTKNISAKKSEMTYNLYQNYPNPFNPVTTIKYTIPAEKNNGVVPVTLKIYDYLGNEIISLVDEQKTSGTYTVQWDGRNTQGRIVASGVYFYRLNTETGYSITKKMAIIK